MRGERGKGIGERRRRREGRRVGDMRKGGQKRRVDKRRGEKEGGMERWSLW